MKKTPKTVLLLVLVAFVLLSAVACESPTDSTTSEQTQKATNTPTVETPDVTTPQPATTPEPTTPETTPEVTPETTPETTPVTTPETTPETTPPENGPEDGPAIDLEGYTYLAYVRSNYSGGNLMENGNPSFYCEDFWYDLANNGYPEDIVSYSVYSRNSTIEREMNVKIRQVNQKGNMADELTKFYTNGTAFDLTIILAKSGAQVATKGLLWDLNSLPALMLEQTAYDQNSIRELSIAGKLYYLSGDMNISTMDCITPTVVNVEMYEVLAEKVVEFFEGDRTFFNIYDVVTSGKWTIDTMFEIATIASVDVNPNDGPLGSSMLDTVGYFQYATSTLYYFYGAGGRITQINNKGVPEFVIQERNNHELFNYIFDTMNTNCRDIPYPYGWSAARKINFSTNANTLFTDMTLWDVRKDLYFSDGFAYGVLPNPVYAEGDDYNAVIHFSNLVHLWAIPTLCNDMFNAQLMMATMASCSDIAVSGSTMDAYYIRTLSHMVASNPQARGVMNTIKNSTVYDIGLLYDWGGWIVELEKLGTQESNNYGSLVSTMPYNAIPKLEETIEQFKNPGYIE